MIAWKLDFSHIIYLTGRPEKYRDMTTEWLGKNDLDFHCYSHLFMRPDGDHRPDYVIKREIYEREIKDKYDVIGVFEDRQQCVDMWRALGLTCFQAAPVPATDYDRIKLMVLATEFLDRANTAVERAQRFTMALDCVTAAYGIARAARGL